MVSRARRAPFLSQPPAEEDAIDPALLEELPEVEERPPLPFPLAMPELPEEPALEERPAYEDAALPGTPLEGELHALLASLETETQMLLASQFARAHERIAAHVGELIARLGEANATIDALRDENARLRYQNDLYERAFKTFKELTAGVEQS